MVTKRNDGDIYTTKPVMGSEGGVATVKGENQAMIAACGESLSLVTAFGLMGYVLKGSFGGFAV